MQLKAQPRRRFPLSLTPLIDVVFLLLIFFMLASTFMKFSAMPISGASGGAVQSDISEIALIQLGPQNSVTVNGQTILVGGLKGYVDALVDKGIKRAVVRTRQGASVQDVVRVLEITRSTRLENVVVVK